MRGWNGIAVLFLAASVAWIVWEACRPQRPTPPSFKMDDEEVGRLLEFPMSHVTRTPPRPYDWQEDGA